MDIITSNFTQVAEGQSGTEVAGILNSALAILYGYVRYDILPVDISSNAVSHTHNKGTRNVIARLYDNNWVQHSLDDIFTLTSENSWELAVNFELTGTWHLIILYLP